MPFFKRHQDYIDPVCGMSVNAANAPARTCYNGIQLYFCSQGCKNEFEAAPQKFTVNQRKGFWHRYLMRLNKATGGRPPACH